MLKKVFSGIAVAGLLFASASASADVIDLFSDDQSLLVVSGGTDSSTAVGGDIIGGERDITVTAGSNAIATAVVGSGELSMGSQIFGGGGDTGFSINVQWDGLDGDASSFDNAGLGSQDFGLLDGFLVEVLSSDGTGTFVIDIWDAAGEQSTLAFTFIPVDDAGPSVSFFIEFGLFTGDIALAGFPVEYEVGAGVNPALDFSQISAIQLTIQGTGETDVRVSSIEVVPEPSSLALMGLALIGLAGVARRKA